MTTLPRPSSGPLREYHFPRYERVTLANGLTVLIAPVTKLPLVSIVTVINAAAAAAEKHGREGMAELTAQMLREGTATRSGSQLAVDLEKLGTSLETGADWDSTVTSLTVLKSRLSEAFGIFSEVLIAPAFRLADVERLKTERLAERMQLLDDPRSLADESFSRFVYDANTRYSQPMGGNAQSIAAIARDDIELFYRGNYVPSAATVILVGDIGIDEGIQLVESNLGGWSGDMVHPIVDADRNSRKSKAAEIIVSSDAAQSELRIGHAGVPRTHPDYFQIVVMNAVLGGLFSSRINLNLREAHGYTYGASSYYDWRRQAGPFVISTAVQSEVTAAAISETLKEIDKIREDGIREDELTLATSYLEGVFPIRYETTSAIASALASMVTFGLPGNYFDTYRANIAAVSTRSVHDAARAYMNPERLQTVVVGDPELIREQMEALPIGPLTVSARPTE